MQTETLESIHPSDWAIAARKQLVRKVIKMAKNQGVAIARIHVSRAFGSVYIDIGTEWDEEYGWLGWETVRVANHARTSYDRGAPTINIYDARSFEQAADDLSELFSTCVKVH